MENVFYSPLEIIRNSLIGKTIKFAICEHKFDFDEDKILSSSLVPYTKDIRDLKKSDLRWHEEKVSSKYSDTGYYIYRQKYKIIQDTVNDIQFKDRSYMITTSLGFILYSKTDTAKILIID